MTTNEKAFVIALIQEYGKIHDNIDKYEEQLDFLDSHLKVSDSGKIKELEYNLKVEVERLAIFRNVEIEFWGEMEKKYGPGDFNPDTLEYNVRKNV